MIETTYKKMNTHGTNPMSNLSSNQMASVEGLMMKSNQSFEEDPPLRNQQNVRCFDHLLEDHDQDTIK